MSGVEWRGRKGGDRWDEGGGSGREGDDLDVHRFEEDWDGLVGG